MPEYTLHIDLNNIPSENEEAKKQLEEFNDKDKAEMATDKVSDKADLKKAAGVAMVISSAKKIANQVVSYPLTTYGARYGDTARQNQIDNFMTVANQVGGLGKAAIGGALVAGAPGAIIATTAALIGDAIEAMQNIDKWNRQHEIDNMNEVRQSERLGLMTSDRNRGRR